MLINKLGKNDNAFDKAASSPINEVQKQDLIKIYCLCSSVS